MACSQTGLLVRRRVAQQVAEGGHCGGRVCRGEGVAQVRFGVGELRGETVHHVALSKNELHGALTVQLDGRSR